MHVDCLDHAVLASRIMTPDAGFDPAIQAKIFSIVDRGLDDMFSELDSVGATVAQVSHEWGSDLADWYSNWLEGE